MLNCAGNDDCFSIPDGPVDLLKGGVRVVDVGGERQVGWEAFMDLGADNSEATLHFESLLQQ